MRHSGLCLMTVLVLAGVAELASAETYPARPIVMIAPFAAGAPVDTVGRIVAERMTRSLGQQIVIENVAGAGGSLGVARAVRAAADGYTISLGNISSHVLVESFYPVQFDVLHDFAPVALLASNPQVIVTRNGFADDLRSAIAWLKANPDRASAGIAGVGSVSHVAGLFFQKETGTRFQFVPYRGVNLAQRDLMGGQIDLLFDQAVNALAHVRAGKIKALAVTSKTRLESAQDIPSVDEAGLPGFYMSVWNALWAPKGTPKELIVKLNAAAMDALADQSVRNRMHDLGLEIPSPEEQTPEALGAFHKAEIDKWQPIIKAVNIKLE
jgi:tripartite-type tricarboxylate transporter receptor subunit TctC